MSDRKDQDKGIIGGAGGNTATGGPGHSDAAGSGAEESELKARRREGAEKAPVSVALRPIPATRAAWAASARDRGRPATGRRAE